MILEIGAERIPLESLEVNITGPVDFQAQFDPFGQNIQGDPRIQITLLSARNDGFGQGYGFGFGQLHGFDQLTGYEFDFGFGEGFGLGFGFKHLSEQEQPRYGSDINKEDLPPGEYSVKFIVHTGNEIKPTFESASVTFVVTAAPLDGDVNGDGEVDTEDLLIVLDNLNTMPPGDPRADLNNDGVVDLRDLAEVARNFGRTGP